MKPEFTAYLKQLGATKPIQDRVEYLYCLCKNIFPGKIFIDIFIDEYLNQDKSRQYTGLTFYSNDFNFSIENFLVSERIEVTHHRKVQNCVAITLQNFDFKKANDQSLMTIELIYDSTPKGYYRASQKNCEHLVRMFKKYIKPAL